MLRATLPGAQGTGPGTSQWDVWSAKGLPVPWGRAGVPKSVFTSWEEGQGAGLVGRHALELEVVKDHPLALQECDNVQRKGVLGEGRVTPLP